MLKINQFVLIICLVLVGLGAAREYLFQTLGTASFLQGLPPFDLYHQIRLPAWSSSSLMLAAAAAICAFLAQCDDGGRNFASKIWYPLCAIFVLSSLDGSASLPAALLVAVGDLFGLTGMFHNAWVWPAIVSAAVFGLLILKAFLSLPIQTQFDILIAGALFVTGALVMEIYGGLLVPQSLLGQPMYRFSIMSDQALEFAGLTICLATFLIIAARWFPGTRADDH